MDTSNFLFRMRTCFNAWGAKRRKKRLKRTPDSEAKRVAHLWTNYGSVPDFLPFSHITCCVCEKHLLPDSFVVLCPLYVHVRCFACNIENLDGKCPCFAEIEGILTRLLGQPDMARKITFLALDY